MDNEIEYHVNRAVQSIRRIEEIADDGIKTLERWNRIIRKAIIDESVDYREIGGSTLDGVNDFSPSEN